LYHHLPPTLYRHPRTILRKRASFALLSIGRESDNR